MFAKTAFWRVIILAKCVVCGEDILKICIYHGYPHCRGCYDKKMDWDREMVSYNTLDLLSGRKIEFKATA